MVYYWTFRQNIWPGFQHRTDILSSGLLTDQAQKFMHAGESKKIRTRMLRLNHVAHCAEERNKWKKPIATDSEITWQSNERTNERTNRNPRNTNRNQIALARNKIGIKLKNDTIFYYYFSGGKKPMLIAILRRRLLCWSQNTFKKKQPFKKPLKREREKKSLNLPFTSKIREDWRGKSWWLPYFINAIPSRHPSSKLNLTRKTEKANVKASDDEGVGKRFRAILPPSPPPALPFNMLSLAYSQPFAFACTRTRRCRHGSRQYVPPRLLQLLKRLCTSIL